MVVRMKLARRMRLSNDPSGHTTMFLHDRRFQWIDKSGVHACSQSHQFLFIDEEPGLAIGHGEEAVADGGEIHADAGCEAAEEEAAGAQDAPQFGEHGVELRVVACEVEDGIAKDDVGEVCGKRHLLDAADLEVFGGQGGVERLG